MVTKSKKINGSVYNLAESLRGVLIEAVETAETKMHHYVDDKFDYMRKELAHEFAGLGNRLDKLEERLSNK